MPPGAGAPPDRPWVALVPAAPDGAGCACMAVASGADSGAAAGASSPTTCVSDNCGFFFDSADTHQTAPATANTAMTNNAGATNLFEALPDGALTIRVRSG